MVEWIKTSERLPEYDNYYCCISEGEYKICFFNPYHSKWFHIGHETRVDFWLDDLEWSEQHENEIYINIPNKTGIMTDESLMPWGKYKGEKMANVSPSYLLWLLDNNKCAGEVKKYIEENKEVLVQQVVYEKKQQR